MLEKLVAFLIGKKYTNVYLDFTPDAPDEVICVYCWEKVAAQMHDGTANHLIQLRVRRYDYETAMTACNAIVNLLDSGPDQTPIKIGHTGAVIGRVRRLPIVLDRTETTVTVYAELALWGHI